MPGHGRWLLPVLFTAPAIALQALPGDVAGGLRYERDLILAGELWRLVTAHFVHLDWLHLALNVSALMLLAASPLGEAIGSAWSASAACVLLMVAVSAALLLGYPGIGWYVGASGFLHGLCTLLALETLRHNRYVAMAALASVAAKVAYEQWLGNPGAAAGTLSAPVVTEAHLYGALAGLALACALPRWERPPGRDPSPQPIKPPPPPPNEPRRPPAPPPPSAAG